MSFAFLEGKAKTASLAIGSKIPPASKASATGKQLLLKKSKKRISQSKLMTTAQDFGNVEEDKENKHKPTKRDLNLACTRRGSRRSFEPMVQCTCTCTYISITLVYKLYPMILY